MTGLEPFFAVAMFLFGLCFGSFLNVCIYRLASYEPAELWLPPGAMRRGGKYAVEIAGRPVLFYCDEIGEEVEGKVRYIGEARMSVVRPRSRCPKCGHQIAWYDNIPVVSWLVLRARCRNCKTHISIRYAVVELATAGLFLACYLQFGLSLLTLKFAVLSFLLLGLIFMDWDQRILPDAFTIPGIFLGLAFSLFVPVASFLSLLVSRRLPVSAELEWRIFSLADAALAAAAGAFLLWAIGKLWKLLRNLEAMGLGDVKLIAVLGAFFGLRPMAMVLFAATFAASLYGLSKVLAVWMQRTRRHMIRRKMPLRAAISAAQRQALLMLRIWHLPFGSFMAAAGIVAIFAADVLTRWYMERLLR